MSLNSELAALANAVANLKKAVRRVILRELGVDLLMKKAFLEGWAMHAETDSELCLMLSPVRKPGLDLFIQETRLWRSPVEAWENSNAEEEV